MAKKPDYNRGFLLILAREAGISPQYLSGIRAKKKVPSPSVAEKLADACSILGINVTRLDLLYPKDSKSTFFNV